MQSVVSHPSGEYILVGTADARVYIFHVAAAASRGSFEIAGSITAMTCDPSGLYLAVAGV